MRIYEALVGQRNKRKLRQQRMPRAIMGTRAIGSSALF